MSSLTCDVCGMTPRPFLASAGDPCVSETCHGALISTQSSGNVEHRLASVEERLAVLERTPEGERLPAALDRENLRTLAMWTRPENWTLAADTPGEQKRLRELVQFFNDQVGTALSGQPIPKPGAPT